MNDKKRPGWHVNAKWVVGVILLPLFAVTFLAFNLYILTNRENGINASSHILTALYLPNANIEGSLVAVRKAIRESPDKTFYPFPDKSIKITEDDLNKYSVEEFKEKIFGELAASVYDSDESTPQKVGFLFVFTKAGHLFIQGILFKLLIAAFILLALAVYFSAGFGRLVTPGVLALLVGVPSTLLFFFLGRSSGESAVPGPDAGWQERIMFIVQSLAPQFELLRKNYSLLTLAGAILVVIGILGGIVKKVRRRNHKLAGSVEAHETKK